MYGGENSVMFPFYFKNGLSKLPFQLFVSPSVEQAEFRLPPRVHSSDP